MPLTGQQVCDEVAWRIQNRIAANSAGAGSLISMTNDALGLIGAASSWIWDATSLPGTTAASLISTLTGGGYPMDGGKKISIFNSTTLTPVVRVTQDEYASAAAGYANVTATEYNAFRTYTDNATSFTSINLYPSSASGTVDVYYHQLPPVLVYGAYPTVRWVVPEMDMLLKDWTTAIAMKWLGLTGWDAGWADCLGRLGEFRKKFTTERENTGPEDEAKSAVGEKNTVGRA